MAAMESLELFLRFGAITLFAWQIALIATRARTLMLARYYAAMSLGLIGFLATHASVDLALPAAVYYPLSVLSKSAALFIWWFVFAIFDDDFRLGRFELGFAAVWVALIPFDFAPVIEFIPEFAGLASATRIVLSIALAVYILAKLFVDYGVDLVETRRRARLWLPAIILALFIADLISDFLTGYRAPDLTYSVLQKLAIFGFAFVVGLFATRLAPIASRVEDAPAQATLDTQTSSDPVTLERLKTAMGEQVYLDPELNLSTLARKLAVSEARLRAVINTDLQYRNFRTFVNQHRVEAAKAALRAPDRAKDPIIAIALESGFNALASFNRVFKDVTGQTPSEFRARF
jgi:AraC-like DNA-binding protein